MYQEAKTIVGHDCNNFYSGTNPKSFIFAFAFISNSK